jgi:uncharacterized protein YeaO (DUF488 family)
MSARIWIRRAYEPPSANDGYRVLVDRVWPRGVSKETARLDEWVRDLAPSNELRQWFDHDPDHWDRFHQQYRDELRAHADEVARLAGRARQRRLTLVFGARDRARNNAVVLREVIEAELDSPGVGD